jgi:hypothetical protein
MDDDRVLSLIQALVSDLLDDGRVDAAEWLDLAHEARMLMVDAGATLPEALATIADKVRDLGRPKPERMIARAMKLEAKAVDLRVRAAQLGDA